MVLRNTSNEWTGPSVREMVASHTLAKEIIARHNDPCPVFDDSSILELRQFVDDPSRAQELLRGMAVLDPPGVEPGETASSKGSLTGFIMATYGTDKSALTDEEILMLKEWFGNGGGKTDAELAAVPKV